MSIMKTGKMVLKVIAAGIVAVTVLSVLLCVYDFLPAHVDNPRKNTDYVWPANSVWFKATEGIAYGRFDANGFNNLVVVENPDVILLGSSHMEATNVKQKESTAYILGEKLKGQYSLYNMGVSGHNIYKVCQYLPKNLELFDVVPQIVIIETSKVQLLPDRVKDVVFATVEYTKSHDGGVIGKLQKIPFFRALYHQVEGGLLDLFLPNDASTEEQENDSDDVSDFSDEESTAVDEEAYEILFSYLKNIEEKYGTQIIIVYHPSETLEKDGSISFGNIEFAEAFSTYSEKYGISFVDMTDRFEKMFYVNHHVPHGFCTGKLAKGHLNKYGHAAIADELFKEIVKLKESKELCR